MADTDRLFDAARRYAQASFGRRAVRIVLHLDDGTRAALPVPVPPVAPLPDRRHSPDFRSVVWDGAEFSLSPTQAAVVGALWRAWEDGTPEVSGRHILQQLDSNADSLRDLFRDSPAWGALIVPGRSRGTYRLPEEQP